MPIVKKKIGLLLPFQRDGRRDFAVVDAEQLIVSQINLVLGTGRGELPWRTTFGSDLNRVRFEASTVALKARVKLMCQRALAAWLPNVTISGVEVERAKTTINIRVAYRTPDEGEKIASVEVEAEAA